MVENIKNMVRQTLLITGSFLLILTLSGQTALLAFGDKTPRGKIQKSAEPTDNPVTETSIIPAPDFDLFNGLKTDTTENGSVPSGVYLGEESEPNGTAATADPLTGAEVKIKGRIMPNGDNDFYSFAAAGGDRVYAGVMTAWDSSASSNSILEVIGTDGTTVLEADLDDGSFAATSSGIAGFVIPAAGTYYLRVRQNSATAQIRPYFLYMALRSAAPTAETEANDTTGTANPLAASGVMSGVVNPAADADFFSVSLNAGETVFLSLNLDPERDNVQFNGRLGFGLFGTGSTQVLVVNDASTGSATNPLSETFYFTVKDAGTYFILVDGNGTAGSATATYTLSASVFPAASGAGCTTYTSADTPIAIPTGPGMISSTINVPATANRIRDVRVFMDATHTFMADLDVHLVSPSGNDNGLFTDVGGATVGGPQTTMNWWIDDNSAIPPNSFALSATMRYLPELQYRMEWFRGEDATGAWRLDIRDDATGDGGTLNSWSLEICTEPPPAGTIIYNENFDANNGGYTHSGTQDEWEYGVPATVATTVSPPVAAFLNCNGGSAGCWKTDLDNTYNASSNQDLLSPNLTLNQFPGVLTLEWAMRFQMESATFDHAFVEVQDVANPANNRIVWEWDGATMTNAVGNPTVNIGASAGWGLYRANISDFAGKTVVLRFHLDSDTTVQVGGLAIDDVRIFHIGPVAANVGVSGRVVDSKGNAISRAYVTLTGANGIPRTLRTNTFGYYRFDEVEVGDTYILNATAKGYTFAPRIVTVQDEITDADMVAIE